VPFPPTSPPLGRALIERNYDTPTPVQTAVLAGEAADRDLLVSAQTGSGKTVAYGLAIGHTILGDAERLGPAGRPLALIVAPTRELALQVERELTWLYASASARIVSCVGGMDPRRERRDLQSGAHIVVGTPGRLRDHLERKGLDISELKALVIDEADEMLDLGFREDLEFILKATPPERRTLMFSATLPKAIVALARRYQRDAFRIEVGATEGGHADIEYRAIRVAGNEVEHAVVNTLRLVESPGALVFCNTRESVRRLQAALFERGFSTVALSGELSQNERNQAMQALRDGRARVLVATDVAARGIDLPSLGLVIHADLPHDSEVLQHRSGRTGRAGRKGISVVLVPQSRRRKAERMMAALGVHPVWSGPPTVEEIQKLDRDRLLSDPTLAEDASAEEIETARALMASRSPEELVAALVRAYRSRLPAPEEVRDPGVMPARREERTPRARGERWAPDTSANKQGWFKLDIGRTKNADPKWLLPMICRRGKITRQEVGTISIFEHETHVEIAEHLAEHFAVSVRRSSGDDDITIVPLNGTVAGTPPPRVPKTKRKPTFAKTPRNKQRRRQGRRGETRAQA
jgi:ATP-dependent RNA helicase DeaD